MRRVVGNIVILVAFVAIAVIAYQIRQRPHSPIVDRRPELAKLVAEQETESAQAVANFVPTIKTQIDDLQSPVVDFLRQLPGVVQVEVGVAAKNPTSRIIHLRDWHFVPKDLFAIETNETHGRKLTAEEIDRLYQEHLLEVELVQIEQMALLRCLIKHHGLKKVFSEGFSPNEVEAYREKIAVLKSMDEEQVPQVRKKLEDIRKLVGELSGEKKEKAQPIEGELVAMLVEHKVRLLEMGASGRLLISGELEGVLPLEAVALRQAKPISAKGEVKADLQKIEFRHDAQVKAAIKEGAVAVIILGGSHDLGESIRRLGGGNCEYLRLTTKRFREIAE